MSELVPESDEAAPRRARRRKEPAGKTRSRRPAKTRKRLVVTLEHPETGEIRQVPTGFAWMLFLFAGVLGVPLFLRRLPFWGAAILALWLVNLLFVKLADGPAVVMEESAVFAIFFLLQLWLGFHGNKITVRTYLRRGWTFTDPDDALTQQLKARWRLAA